MLTLVKEGDTAWRTYFQPVSDEQESISVPAQWADFMTIKLLTPANFHWAKSILQSQFWQLIQQGCAGGISREFALNHAESASVGKYTYAEHPSSNYKGICIAIIDDDACNRVSLDNNSKNCNGFCHYYACWCQGVCTSETETQAVASVPIRQWSPLEQEQWSDPSQPSLIIILYNIVCSVYYTYRLLTNVVSWTCGSK